MSDDERRHGEIAEAEKEIFQGRNGEVIVGVLSPEIKELNPVDQEEKLVEKEEEQKKPSKRPIVSVKHTKEIHKQIRQFAYEFIRLSQCIDLYREKGLVSGTPIPKKTLGYNARIGLIAPHVGYIYAFSQKGRGVIEEAKNEVWNILSSVSEKTNIGGLMMITGERPENIKDVGAIFSCRQIESMSIALKVAIISFILVQILHGIAKIGDVKQINKQRKNDSKTKK